MELAEFTERFQGSSEIGRFVTETYTLVYHDNGIEVGIWRQKHDSKGGYGEVMPQEEWMSSRLWWLQQKEKTLYIGNRNRDVPPVKPDLP